MDLQNEILKTVKNIETMLSKTKSRAEKLTLSLEEAAEYLKISKHSLYKKTSTATIPFYKPGGKIIVFYKDELDEWLKLKSVTSHDEIVAEANRYITINQNKTFGSKSLKTSTIL